MNCSISINNQSYVFDTEIFFDLSIPINFKGDQVNFFDVSSATSVPYKSGKCLS